MNSDDEKISSIYHEADTPAPSKSLDDAVLAASRDAVEKPSASKGPFTGGWPAAASIAAVIVITIILVPILKHEEPQQTLKRMPIGKSSTLESTEDTGLNAFEPSEIKKKRLGALSPANEPLLLMQEDLLTDDEAMPAASGISSRAARTPSTSEAIMLESKEEQAIHDTSDMDRSRMQAADSAPFAIHTPEMWEVKISRLIEDGSFKEAKAEIEKLKQHYPEYRINQSLLEKLN